MMRETGRAWACALLSAALLAGWLAPPAPAQERKRKPVVVSFGQPSIWSLEQAHYLLARMHQENLELRAKGLAALDPNETHSTRIQILKEVLGISAEFDDTIRFQNSRRTRNIEFNDARRLELTSERDRLRAESRRAKLDVHRLELERAAMNKDNSTEEQRALKDAELKRRREDAALLDTDIQTLSTDITALGNQPIDAPTAPTPSASPFNKSTLPDSIFNKLGDDELKKLFADVTKSAKLNATTQLDNHVQMQYEIIAKQLTLLRDEVGPGERLVFLELPQSVYTTPGPGDEKMAQAWWHVNGYTRTDPLLRLLLELYEVELKWKQIKAVPGFNNFVNKVTDGQGCDRYRNFREEVAKNEREGKRDQSRNRVLEETFHEFQCEYENARQHLFNDLFREARSDFARAQQGGARDTSELVQAIRESIAVRSLAAEGGKAGKRLADRDRDREEDAEGEIRRSVDTRQVMTDETVRGMRKSLLCLLSDPDLELDNPASPSPKLIQGETSKLNGRLNCGDLEKFDFKKGIKYVRMEGRADRGRADGLDDGVSRADIELRTVRTVDIIPRQSALNVNDIQSTVKATGILAAFKFLFGFAGTVNYQRQREQFEQFIHQELYASGFGKGNRDFGWTFGALPGTKRVAPGVRTTYAVLVVPDDAESLVLSARGCYFPRKSYQPLDFEDTSHKDWDRESRLQSYNCNDEQTYIVPIPGGGDRADFWVTHVDYRNAEKGKRAAVSIRGKNFSTQMGVLVNGTPLWQVVGLAQPLLQARLGGSGGGGTNASGGAAAPAPTPPACAEGGETVCGYVERIDPEQIVFSFTMPKDFAGIPTITLVAPGKSVDINWLPNLTINGVRNKRLDDVAMPFVFGAPTKRPEPKLTITDFKVFSVGKDNRQAFAILTGTEFTEDDIVYVNGKLLPKGPLSFLPPPPPPRRRRGRRPPPPEPRRLAEFKEFKSDKLYRLVFDMPPGEELTVTVTRPGAEPASKSIPNPVEPEKGEEEKEKKPPSK